MEKGKGCQNNGGMKLRRKKGFKLSAMLLLAVFVLSGCGILGGGTSNGNTKWEYEKTIKNPITAMCFDEEVVLGNLETEGVEVTIPAGTFKEPTEVTLVNPDKVPKYASAEMTAFGSPIDISIGAEEARLQEMVTIKMKFDLASLGGEDLESGSLYMGYFNGKEWQYIKPVVDRNNQTMTFATSHFCLFGQTKLTVDQRINNYTNNAALADWAQKQSDDITNAAAEKLIDHMLKDKLGIDDESIRGKVLGSLLKDDEWGGMVEGLANGDVVDFNKNLQVLAGKKIAENVPTSFLSKALGGLTTDFGLETVEKASEAAGYLAEGRVTDAAKIIGEHFADQFIITQVGKVAVAAVENKIASWKNEEVEAAYQAYKNGASSRVPWWGYQVEKGNFEDVWSQMGGAARQLMLEAIKAQDEARKDIGMPPLSAAEKDKIREIVKNDLRKQFEQRVKTDAEIEKVKAEYEMIMDMYKEAGFMEKGRWGWDKSYDLEQRLDLLVNFKNKVLRDTGRDFIKKGYMHGEDSVALDELKLMAMDWFTTPDPVERQKKYAEFIKNEFGIDLFPKAEDLNGQWSSATMTITNFDLGPPPEESETPEPSGDGDDSGCDLFGDLDFYALITAALEDAKGKPRPIDLVLQLGPDGKGTMTFSSEEEDQQEAMEAVYQHGTLSASMTEEGMHTSFVGNVSDADGMITIDGEFLVGLGEDAWIEGTWTAKK